MAGVAKSDSASHGCSWCCSVVKLLNQPPAEVDRMRLDYSSVDKVVMERSIVHLQ